MVRATAERQVAARISVAFNRQFCALQKAPPTRILNPLTMSETRLEKDSMGPMEVPANALYGASTQRVQAHARATYRKLEMARISRKPAPSR